MLFTITIGMTKREREGGRLFMYNNTHLDKRGPHHVHHARVTTLFIMLIATSLLRQAATEITTAGYL